MPSLIDLASGYRLELPSSPTSFGTAPDNTFPVSTGFDIHPRHFQVTPVPGGCIIVDLTGAQSTMVNGAAVTQTLLQHGDIITAGRLRLKFECAGAALPAMPPDPVLSAMAMPMAAGAPPLPLPLPPEVLPPPLTGVNTAGAPQLPGDYGSPQPLRSYTPRSKAAAVSYEKGGKTSMPNAATAIHLYKWMLPVMGLILWGAKWVYNIYSVKSDIDDAGVKAAAYSLVETFREAQTAKAPGLASIHDANRAVRMLVSGIRAQGEDGEQEFKVYITREEAEDALDYLIWKEGTGLMLIPELQREYRGDSYPSSESEMEPAADEFAAEPEEI